MHFMQGTSSTCRQRLIVCAATTASAVLNCEGALPKLLELLVHSSNGEKLNSRLLTASAQVTLTQVPSLDEIKEVIEKVSLGLPVSANVNLQYQEHHPGNCKSNCKSNCMFLKLNNHLALITLVKANQDETVLSMGALQVHQWSAD